MYDWTCLERAWNIIDGAPWVRRNEQGDGILDIEWMHIELLDIEWMHMELLDIGWTHMELLGR